ncbi:MAG: hypothetical protein ACOYN6_11570 [Ignavibacteria bacterium]
MSNLFDVKKATTEFLTGMIKCTDITVLKMEKVSGIWNVISEVYEDDSFMKSMKLPVKKVRLFYSVKLDESLEAVSYERLSNYEGTDGSVV